MTLKIALNFFVVVNEPMWHYMKYSSWHSNRYYTWVLHFVSLAEWRSWIVEHWRHCGIIHEQMKKTSGGFQKRSITYNMLVELGVKMIAIIQTATGGSLCSEIPTILWHNPQLFFHVFLCIRKPSHDMTDWNAVNACCYILILKTSTKLNKQCCTHLVVHNTNTRTLTLSYRSKGYDKSLYCSLI